MIKVSSIVYLLVVTASSSAALASSLEHEKEPQNKRTMPVEQKDLPAKQASGAEAIVRLKTAITDFAQTTISPKVLGDGPNQISKDYVIKYFGLTTPAGLKKFEESYSVHGTLADMAKSGLFHHAFDENFVKARQLVRDNMDEANLNLAGLGLKVVPAEIAQMKNLKELNLSSNSLSVFPASLATMDLLTSLDLRENALKRLPDDISKMRSLKNLLLSNNQIEGLPVSVGDLPNLEVLDLKGNQLELIPRSLIKLKGSLKVLDVSNNHLRPKLAAINPISATEQEDELIKGLPDTKINLQGQTQAPHLGGKTALSRQEFAAQIARKKEAERKFNREAKRGWEERQSQGKDITIREKPEIIEDYNPQPDNPEIALDKKEQDSNNTWWWPF